MSVCSAQCAHRGCLNVNGSSTTKTKTKRMAFGVCAVQRVHDTARQCTSTPMMRSKECSLWTHSMRSDQEIPTNHRMHEMECALGNQSALRNGRANGDGI